MRTDIHPTWCQIWLSSEDIDRWVDKPGAHWPCSTLKNHRLWAMFDKTGLQEIQVDGLSDFDFVDIYEFNAIIADHFSKELQEDHPCYEVVVGQFKSV